MVHVGGISPSLGSGLPKSPTFHQGLAFAAVQPHDNNKQQQQQPPYSNIPNAQQPPANLYYQPIRPLLVGTWTLENTLILQKMFISK